LGPSRIDGTDRLTLWRLETALKRITEPSGSKASPSKERPYVFEQDISAHRESEAKALVP